MPAVQGKRPMLDNIMAYLSLEQNDTWEAYHKAALSQWRDVFKMQAAWKRRDPGVLEGGHVTAAASMNIAVLELYRYAMGENMQDINHRYGGFV